MTLLQTKSRCLTKKGSLQTKNNYATKFNKGHTERDISLIPQDTCPGTHSFGVTIPMVVKWGRASKLPIPTSRRKKNHYQRHRKNLKYGTLESKQLIQHRFWLACSFVCGIIYHIYITTFIKYRYKNLHVTYTISFSRSLEVSQIHRKYRGEISGGKTPKPG